MTHLAKIAMLGITLALVTSAAQAQTKSTHANANDDGTVPQPLGLRTVVGCVSRTAGTYVITGGAPGPKQFRIVSGDVSSLESRMGYTVKVVGIVGKNDPLANSSHEAEAQKAETCLAVGPPGAFLHKFSAAVTSHA